MSEDSTRWHGLIEAMPLVAILRGVRPEEVVELASAIVEAGIRVIEVPLNSPDPFASIEALAAISWQQDILVGAGTVTDTESVKRLGAAGGRLVVMPHADPEVIAAAVAARMACVPGVLTPTEAFAALHVGAHALKVFPAELVTPAVMKAVLTVLPPQTKLLPVGGITPASMADYWVAGARGFGLGSGLYRPGMDADSLHRRAADYVTAARELKQQRGEA